jgi:hypothetical protein
VVTNVFLVSDDDDLMGVICALMNAFLAIVCGDPLSGETSTEIYHVPFHV